MTTQDKEEPIIKTAERAYKRELEKNSKTDENSFLYGYMAGYKDLLEFVKTL